MDSSRGVSIPPASGSSREQDRARVAAFLDDVAQLKVEAKGIGALPLDARSGALGALMERTVQLHTAMKAAFGSATAEIQKKNPQLQVEQLRAELTAIAVESGRTFSNQAQALGRHFMGDAADNINRLNREADLAVAGKSGVAKELTGLAATVGVLTGTAAHGAEFMAGAAMAYAQPLVEKVPSAVAELRKARQGGDVFASAAEALVDLGGKLADRAIDHTTRMRNNRGVLAAAAEISVSVYPTTSIPSAVVSAAITAGRVGPGVLLPPPAESGAPAAQGAADLHKALSDLKPGEVISKLVRAALLQAPESPSLTLTEVLQRVVRDGVCRDEKDLEMLRSFLLK